MPPGALDRQAAAVRANLARPAVADDQRRDHVRVVGGPQPYRHNHHAATDFFRADAAAGTVSTVYGQRTLRVGDDFLPALLAALEGAVGDAAGEAMYQCGYQWGVRDMAAFAARAGQEFEVEFEKMSMGVMLETWWQPFTAAGWGTWRYDFHQAGQGLIFVDLFDSAVAGAVGPVGKVACSLYAGLFAACFSHLAKRDLACVEVQCKAAGEESCKFMISTAKRVNAAAFWRHEGATTKDAPAEAAP